MLTRDEGLPTQSIGSTYYIDGRNGNDSHPGHAPERSWRSIERVNHAALAPGDRVFFAGGQAYPGKLRFSSAKSGVREAPVLVSSYGPDRATIKGGSGDGIEISDCGHVVLRRLKVLGCGRAEGNDGAGVRLLRTWSVEIDDLEVSGFRLAGIATGGDIDTRITRVHAHGNGFAGISSAGGSDGLPRTRNLYLGRCVVENNPGDPKNLDNHSGNGIVVSGLDGGLIEHCEAMNNGWDMPRAGNGPVGIWGWNCDRLVIQHCVSHDNRSPGEDGGGFDFDGGVTRSIMQYNLSYRNAGCGYLLCQFPGASPWFRNIVRHNVSIDDGWKNFRSGIGLWLGGSGISDGLICHNTIVNPHHAVRSLGCVPGMVYRDNRFFVGGDPIVGDFSRSRFEYNHYGTPDRSELLRGGRDRFQVQGKVSRKHAG